MLHGSQRCTDATLREPTDNLASPSRRGAGVLMGCLLSLKTTPESRPRVDKTTKEKFHN